MPGQSVRELAAAITASSRRRGCHRNTLQLFGQLLRLSARPNIYVLPSVLRACANARDLKTGRELHGVIVRSLDRPDSFVCTALMDVYCKCGRLDLARVLFNGMPDRDLVAWNSMVSGYALQGFARTAWTLVEEMSSVGLQPDLFTWNSLLSGFAQGGDVTTALNLFRSMNREGIEPDVVSWTSLISGFVRSLRFQEAFAMFRQMMLAGAQPSSITVSVLLPACASVANLRFGREIHGHTVVSGAEGDLYAASSLLDMYAKCGFILEAEKLFCGMSKRSVVTYNMMIFGCANHGYCEKAVELFNHMVFEGSEEPDHLTFTAIIMACAHAGWVEMGKNLFELMQRKYGIGPRLEHYACMVDLLGRSGNVTEAYEFINQMPVKPDSFVWGALLGACKSHGNVELAEVAASHLYKLEPRSAGSPVLLSNAFMDLGRWEDAVKLKKIVKRKKLKRSTGCSWLEVTLPGDKK